LENEAMKEKAQARTKILNAAEEVFACRGFGGARTADIARSAGVNKALLHYYFATKEGLYQSVMDRLLFELIELAQGVLKKGLKGRELVNGIFDAFFDYAAKHRYFVRLTTADNAGKQGRYLENMLRNFFRPLFARAQDHLESEAKKGRLQKIDAPNFLITIYLSILSFFSDTKFVSAVAGYDVTASSELAKRKAFLKKMIEKMTML